MFNFYTCTCSLDIFNSRIFAVVVVDARYLIFHSNHLVKLHFKQEISRKMMVRVIVLKFRTQEMV